MLGLDLGPRCADLNKVLLQHLVDGTNSSIRGACSRAICKVWSESFLSETLSHSLVCGLHPRDPVYVLLAVLAEFLTTGQVSDHCTKNLDNFRGAKTGNFGRYISTRSGENTNSVHTDAEEAVHE